MMNNENILGCYVSSTVNSYLPESEREIVFEKGRVFRSYLWGDYDLAEKIKILKYTDYGNDLKIILFEFYVDPIPELLMKLKKIESYRKKEKAIGIPVVITDENFFSKSEESRHLFLKNTILDKLDLVADVALKIKIDTKIDLIKSDLQKILA